MLKISHEDVQELANKMAPMLTNGTDVHFDLFKYHKKLMRKLHDDANIKYPVQIKLPKSIEALKNGDYEPGTIITLEGPIMVGPDGDQFPIWFGDCVDIMVLRPGYINGDSRKIPNIEVNGPSVHSMFAGATGQGKSVTLLSILLTLMAEYGPWSLLLYLCDPKAVELKIFGMECATPHIRTVAATEDTDFTVSAMKNLVDSMNAMNQILADAKVQNIWTFKKRYGLTLPRNILLADEFETLLKKSKKKLSIITDCIDSTVKLGRNTGFHLMFASQNVPSDLDKGILGNITIRGAMGCNEATSNLILGNNKARYNMGLPGRLIINLNSEAKKEKDNINIIVPYVGDTHRNKTTEWMNSAVKPEWKLNTKISFYDDLAYLLDKDIPKYLDNIGFPKDSIYIGEPTFVTPDQYNTLRLELTGVSYENLCVYSTVVKEQVRLLLPVVASMSRIGQMHIVSIPDETIASEIDMSILNPVIIDKDDTPTRDSAYLLAMHTFNIRMLAMLIDSKVGNYSYSENELYEEYFDKIIHKISIQGIPENKLRTKLNKDRYYYAMDVLSKDIEYLKTLGLDSFSSATIKEDRLNTRLAEFFIWISDKGKHNICMEKSDLPFINYWVLGIDSFKSIGKPGTSASSAEYKAFRSLLSDAKRVNMRVIYSVANTESIVEFHNDLKWYITSKLSTQDINRTKSADYYPTTILSNQGVLVDITDKEEMCKKFKTVKFSNEIYS